MMKSALQEFRIIQRRRADAVAVIVDGAFTAMSEFLKSRLGAGCVDD